MPEEQFVDPEEVRAKGKLSFEDIPLNQYDKTIEEEKENYTEDELIRIYRDMALIREFETMVGNMKTSSEYKGVKHNYLGPSHLYFGQEASAVGQAYSLDTSDYILGSHRSHGEILAKGCSAIEKLSENELMNIMKNFKNGKILKVIKENSDSQNVKELALEFLLYGASAEIFFKDNGFNRGLGGSMHAFFPPFGIYPNNAIVGGSAPISTGAALYKKIQKEKGIVIANIGDGSLGCGPVWESINFSAMGQMKNLWDKEYSGGLPIIFNFMDNQYGMGGQTAGETMAFDILARFGAGVNPEQLHAERIDGYNPLAVIEGVKRKKKILEKGEGPVLLDTLTYRLGGHSTSDANAYRTKEEIQSWEENDCLLTYKDKLIKAGIAKEDQFAEIDKQIEDKMVKICKLAVDNDVSPYMEDPEEIGDLMFSDKKVAKKVQGECETLQPKEENSRVKRLKNRERVGIKEGKEVSKIKRIQIRDALFESIIDKLYEDPSLIIYGEDHRHWGGAFAVYNGLTEAMPYHRFFNAPISEAAITGSAVGYALSGGLVIVELMYADFIGRSGDEIFNQMAKWQAMSAGILDMPLVLRISIGNKYGAQHSQDWTSLISHIPGLKVVYPVTPYDAKGLMNSALNGTDPVVFFEKQNLYDKGEEFRLEEGVPEDNYEITIGEPDIKREGEDITILSVGSTLYRAREAADILEEEHDVSSEIIDARSIVPFNYEKVIESVKKTGKIVITGDQCQRGSILNDFSQNISELAFDYLDGPPVVVGSRNWITPSTDLEEYFFPQPRWIIDAIHEKILPLDNYVPENNYTRNEQIRRNKKGI